MTRLEGLEKVIRPACVGYLGDMYMKMVHLSDARYARICVKGKGMGLCVCVCVCVCQN